MVIVLLFGGFVVNSIGYLDSLSCILNCWFGFACFGLLVVIVAACLFIVCYDYVACWWLVV